MEEVAAVDTRQSDRQCQAKALRILSLWVLAGLVALTIQTGLQGVMEGGALPSEILWRAGPALLSALAEPRTGLAALGLMVMGTALPFTLYTKGLETVESGKAAIIANIEPVMSAVIGVTVFQETLGLWTLVGIVLVLSGVVVLACEKEPDK